MARELARRGNSLEIHHFPATHARSAGRCRDRARHVGRCSRRRIGRIGRAHLLHGQRRGERREPAEALVAAFEAANPDIKIDLDSSGPSRCGGRQPPEDKARDGRDRGHLLVQLRFALPGVEPRRGSLLNVRRTSRGQQTPPRRVHPNGVHRERSVRRSGRHGDRWRCLLPHPRHTRSWVSRCPRRGTSSWRTTPRSRKPARSRSSSRSVTRGRRRSSCWPTSSTSARYPGSGWADQVHEQRGEVRDRPVAMAGFQHGQDVFEAGFLNDDFGSTTFDDALNPDRSGRGQPTTRC